MRSHSNDILSLTSHSTVRTYSSKCIMIIWDTVSLTRRHLVQSFRVQAARLPRWVAAATRSTNTTSVHWAPWQQLALLLLPYFSPLVEANLQSPDHETCCQLEDASWDSTNETPVDTVDVCTRLLGVHVQRITVVSNVCNVWGLSFYPSMNPCEKCTVAWYRHTQIRSNQVKL